MTKHELGVGFGFKKGYIPWNKGKKGTYKVRRTKNKLQKRMVRGYVWVLYEKHPFANAKGYVCEHRLVMEKFLGRLLTKKEVIHHINMNKSDNRIENLQLFSSRQEHMKGNVNIALEVQCPNCNFNFLVKHV